MQKHKNKENKKCHIDECKLEMKRLMTTTYIISNSIFPSFYHYQSLAAVPFLETISSGRFIWPISLDTNLMVPLSAPRSSHATHPTLPEPSSSESAS